MTIYSYIVDHEEYNPTVSINTKINGGKIIAVGFYDAFERIEEIEKFLVNLRNETKDNQTRYSIDEFLSSQ